MSTPDQDQMLARLEASLEWHQAQAEERVARRVTLAAEAEARALEPRDDHLEDFMARLEAVEIRPRRSGAGPVG